MNKPIHNGIVKGVISSFEFIQGYTLGRAIDSVYKDTDLKMNEKVKTSLYILISAILGFVTLEMNQYLFKKPVKNIFKYTEFSWPTPMLFGFGLLFYHKNNMSRVFKDS